MLIKEPKPSYEERRAEPHCWAGKAREETFFATHHELGGWGWKGAAKSAVKETFLRHPTALQKERVCICKIYKQEHAQSREEDGAMTFWCRRILLQEPRGKSSQGTRTRGGQPMIELVASVMKQRMRVTSR